MLTSTCTLIKTSLKLWACHTLSGQFMVEKFLSAERYLGYRFWIPSYMQNKILHLPVIMYRLRYHLMATHCQRCFRYNILISKQNYIVWDGKFQNNFLRWRWSPIPLSPTIAESVLHSDNVWARIQLVWPDSCLHRTKQDNGVGMRKSNHALNRIHLLRLSKSVGSFDRLVRKTLDHVLKRNPCLSFNLYIVRRIYFEHM